MISFIDIRPIDFLDIAMTAYLMYAIYKLIKGTMAASIAISILAFLVVWAVVRTLNMSMLSAVMGSFVNIGLLALVVIFQQEIRNFLVLISSRNKLLRSLLKATTQTVDENGDNPLFVDAIVNACSTMSENQTGALIVITREVGLKEYVETGNELNAQFSQQLIETVFFKNSPLHDGAMIVDKKQIMAAGCILPISKDPAFPKAFGLRHRSAKGITEVSDAISIVVSEETGKVSVFDRGNHQPMSSAKELRDYLEQL